MLLENIRMKNTTFLVISHMKRLHCQLQQCFYLNCLQRFSRQFGTSFIKNNVFMEFLKLECRTKNTILLFLSTNFIFPCDQRHVNIFHSLLNHECLSYTNFFLGLVWFGFTLIFGQCLNSLLCVTIP